MPCDTWGSNGTRGAKRAPRARALADGRPQGPASPPRRAARAPMRPPKQAAARAARGAGSFDRSSARSNAESRFEGNLAPVALTWGISFRVQVNNQLIMLDECSFVLDAWEIKQKKQKVRFHWLDLTRVQDTTNERPFPLNGLRRLGGIRCKQRLQRSTIVTP